MPAALAASFVCQSCAALSVDYVCSLLVQVELSPLENAIAFVKDGITALKSQIRRLKNDETTSSNQLTMKLQGILDAAVSGGLKNYEVRMHTRTYVYTVCLFVHMYMYICNVHTQAQVSEGGDQR